MLESLPGFFPLGSVGSPIDVATFVLVLTMVVFRLRPRVQLVAAGVVALARGRDDVDDDRLAYELDVDEQAVEMLKPEVIYREDNDG
jgi:hypothetical protein